MKYRIYALKNDCGKIVYVGFTKRELVYRMYEHHKIDGRKNLVCELLAQTDDKEKAKELETYYIQLYNTSKCGLNITDGMGRKNIGANKTSFKRGNEYCYLGTRKVKCIETGIIYDSVTECAKANHANISKITDCCKGRRKTTNKLHFQYID